MSFAPLLNVAKSLAPSLVIKGLERINPKFKNFFTEALAYGYTADNALNYLTEKFSSTGSNQFKKQLQSGAEQGTLRHDEASALGQIEASETPGNILKSATGFGGAGLLGLGGREGGQTQQQAQPQGPLQGVDEALNSEKARSESFK